jgi:NAD(P)H-dependent flavin oxidoreductase YrpB (nitropropane dioxygenase family)
MIHTPICDLLGIRYPLVLGGMAAGHTSAPLVAAVSNAGGLGTMGLSTTSLAEIGRVIGSIRAATKQPFGVNFLLFVMQEPAFAAALEARPPVMAFAWASREQDLRAIFVRSREAGSTVMYMASTVPEAARASEAGADVIVAQGCEGGGHVGTMGTLPLLPMVVDAVAPTPVLAAGGIADGRGLAAALALGAQGALLGTRFLATVESPIHANFKQAILDSDGHDTVATQVIDVARGRVWPGAVERLRRNALVARWAGREWAARAEGGAIAASLQRAVERGDVEEAQPMMGQDAGLIHDLPPAGELVQRIVDEAEAVLASRLPALLRKG